MPGQGLAVCYHLNMQDYIRQYLASLNGSEPSANAGKNHSFQLLQIDSSGVKAK
jgi:hypothetical protein